MVSEPAGAHLAAERLSFAYRHQPVLHDVSLEARPGEIVGLLGPNGSGKSTLIRLLSGVLRPSAGSVLLDGRELARHTPREIARRVAVVPQETGFVFPFRVLDTVLMGRHPHLAGLSFESERDLALAQQALERSGAGRMAARRIHELSSGERQRVVFARALAQQPRALLLDEPTSFLDVRHQVELFDVVRELAEGEGRTVLTVQHDINLAAEYCHRLYLLKQGRIAAHGPTGEVLTYANLTQVFETEVYVDTNALTGKLLVVPLSGQVQRKLKRPR